MSQTEPASWFIFQGYGLLIYQQEEGKPGLPSRNDLTNMAIPLIRQQYLGCFEDDPTQHYYSGEVDEDYQPPKGAVFLSLRRLYGQLSEKLMSLAGRAVQIVDWDRTHQFCSRCGATTENQAHERAKKCPTCSLISYPRISPAIIVSIERQTANGGEILLAHHANHRAKFYSVLAGFVEPGETLEECVKREVKEEVNIDVENIRYFGSQPWPFPNSLMLAFTAEYAGGEIVVQEEELVSADWYSVDDLPNIPSSVSIARSLIDRFVAKNGSSQ